MGSLDTILWLVLIIIRLTWEGRRVCMGSSSWGDIRRIRLHIPVSLLTPSSTNLRMSTSTDLVVKSKCDGVSFQFRCKKMFKEEDVWARNSRNNNDVNVICNSTLRYNFLPFQKRVVYYNLFGMHGQEVGITLTTILNVKLFGSVVSCYIF